MPTRFTIPSPELKQRFSMSRDFLWDLCRRIDAEHAFNFDDWEILYYTLENFRPDFVFELGRGEGNSTSVIQEYCLRHAHVDFMSVDLYNTWEQEVIKRLPQDLPEALFNHDFRHMDFLEFDIADIIDRAWNRMLIFWDVNDQDVAKRMVKELLPRLQNRPVLVCMHDASNVTGRPRRYHWREYESLYQDLEIVGQFIDRKGWAAGVPDSRHIFGHYRNAGHWLIFESPGSVNHNAEHLKKRYNE